MIICIQLKNHPFKNHIVSRIPINSYFYAYLDHSGNFLKVPDKDRSCETTMLYYSAIDPIKGSLKNYIGVNYNVKFKSLMFTLNEKDK